MKTIQIECPKCHRQKRVRRQPYDPKSAKKLKLLCDKCDTGGGFTGSESDDEAHCPSRNQGPGD